MDSLLVLLSSSLVAYKIIDSKRKRCVGEKQVELAPMIHPQTLTNADAPDTPETLTTADYEHFEAVGAAQPAPPQREPSVPAFLLSTRPATMSHPQVAELRPQRLTEREDDGTGVQQFNEQFFPQDTKSTGQSVNKTPWMRAIEASQAATPKTEREEAHPSADHDRDDIRGISIPAMLRVRDQQQAAQTISNFKNFESPVTEEWTANGENRGLHPIKRYHKFLLSDQPVLELPEGPRGNFASGADKPSFASELDNNRRELHVQHTGIPAASFRVGIPDASFDLQASNAEHWRIDAHVSSASRAPVDSGSNTALINQSFTLTHDEQMDTLAVADRANLSKANLPRSDINQSVNPALVKTSFTGAHDENLDLAAIREKSGISRANLPTCAEHSNLNSALVKASFRLPHDGGVDLMSVRENSNQTKTHLPPTEAPPVPDMATAERGVATPSVVRATGGIRKKHKDKSSEIRSVSQKENLTFKAHELSTASGKKASKPQSASRASEHEHTEGTLAEEETSSRVRGAPHTRKASDTSKFKESKSQFSLENSKDKINTTPFTSTNFVAPKAQGVPAFLSVAPTASMSLSQKELSLKPSSGGLTDMFSMGRNKNVTSVKTNNLSEREPEQKETKLRSVILNRPNKGVVVANPYNRPRPTIQ